MIEDSVEEESKSFGSASELLVISNGSSVPRESRNVVGEVSYIGIFEVDDDEPLALLSGNGN